MLRLYRDGIAASGFNWVTGRSAWGACSSGERGLLRESRWCAAYRELPVGNPINGRAPRLLAAAAAPWCTALHPAGITRSAGFTQGVRREVNAFRFAAGRGDTRAPQTTTAIPRITIPRTGVAAFRERQIRKRRFPCRSDSAVFSCRKLSDESRARDPGIPRHPTDAESVRSELASERRGMREFVRSRTRSGNPRFAIYRNWSSWNCERWWAARRNTVDSLFTR